MLNLEHSNDFNSTYLFFGFCKFMFAGVVAVIILNIVCLAYYKLPVHITTKTGVTDYYWEPHTYYSKMTEGFGYGKMNNEGFNNIKDYTKGENVNVLLMGSSQMEATSVPQKDSTAALLNKYFNGKEYVYNIGISGHSLDHLVSNLNTALSYYQPKSFVVMETMGIQFSTEALQSVLEGTVQRIPSYTSRIMFILQKFPYLRLMYSQLKNLGGQESVVENLGAESAEPVYTNGTTDITSYAKTLSAVMHKVYTTCLSNDVKPIIFFHPHLTLNVDGTATPQTDNQYLFIFKNACENNGITFIDMTNVFMRAYDTEHILPHGFWNTKVGAGHLNKEGMSLIAQTLYNYMGNAGQV